MSTSGEGGRVTPQRSVEQGNGRSGGSAIERAIELLIEIGCAKEPVSLGVVAAEVDLPRPTAHRILRTLVDCGVVRQEDDRTYCAGPRLYALSGRVLAGVDYERKARDGLKWLKGETRDTIHLALLKGDTLIYVEKLDGDRPYQMGSTIGMSLGMHCTAAGKVVLAFCSQERREACLGTDGVLAAHTDKTITDGEILEKQLTEIRAQGFAVDDEENEETIRCVGAPVFGAQGQVVGGVTVAAPTFHLALEDAPLLARSVMTSGRMISDAFGAPKCADVSG